MSLWMSSNRLGSERSLATEIAKNNSVPYYPPGSTQPTESIRTMILMTGDNDFVDSSASARTITNVGASTVFSPSKVGSKSFQFDTGYFYAPDSTDFDIAGKSHFQFDCWVYNTSRATNVFPASTDRPVLVNKCRDTDATPEWAFGPNNDGILTLYYYSGSNNEINSTGTVPLNTWTHIAFNYTSATNLLRMFMGGIKVYDATIAAPVAISLADVLLKFGQMPGYVFQGNMDEARLIINTSDIYTEDFTPTPIPYLLV